MNRLFNNMGKLHLFPLVHKANTKELFIFKFSLLVLLIVTSCNNANVNVDEKHAGSYTAKKIELGDTTKPQDKKANQSDSFFIALKKGRKVYGGDFDTMLKRRIVRVLAPFSRTLFFNDKGKVRGISADSFREFEEYLNKKYRKNSVKIPVTVVFIPTPRDELIPGILAGLGDIAAGNLTATEERSKQVDFFAPKDLGSISELILTRKQDSAITNVEGLSGKTVYVRKSSSYFESLQKLNEMLTVKGKSPVKLDTASEYLEDEDLMEMLNAGIISTIIVDDWIAKMWAQILPSIRVNNVSVQSGGYIGWSFRKNSPLLTEELKDFYYGYEKKLGAIPYRLKKYYGQVKYLQDPTNSGNAKRYKEIMQLFEKYGRQYDFDPLMLAALGFQESRLDQSNRSSVGAVGIMQLMPATGAAMKVGNITVTEPNIHAGAKFINMLVTKYFQDAHFDEFNRSLFAFASYNAGPAKIEKLRKAAAARGLNPNVWLGSVEIVASEKIGRETTTYVRNIVKYYCSYKLMLEQSHQEKKTLKQ
ncbi:transporter substrate-binding domain-containing protein [Chitinophagaceae bacterium 26-R-25]|nr:transporter substrate-binding domain-containing protein [Chitinophagaceae bacterium 26-R-25]